MKKFILKSSLFLITFGLFVLFVFKQADGYTDPFYLRFTSPKQSSLVLGTSRAAQGIMPSVLNRELGRGDIYNFSFTNIHSPYGATYYNSILKKLKADSKKGIYILAVDPWCISSNNSDSNNENKFRENNRFLGKLRFMNLNPNIPYLLDNYNKQFIHLFDEKQNTRLHNDGWLEVNVKIDPESNNKYIKKKTLVYKEKLKIFNFSEKRNDVLLKTVKTLKKHGEVYVVRLPVHPKMMQVDSALIPDFNFKIQKVIQASDGYLDLTPYNNDYIYTDGNHLYKESSRKVSKRIAEWIRNKQK